MARNLILLTVWFVGAQAAWAQAPANLLRNAAFQDDWLTLLPELKNHHWNYSSEFYHRRDFNPDGWSFKGAWQWLNADKPYGQRRLVLDGPAELLQRVNWVAIHDDRSLSGFPDAGGFPGVKAVRSRKPDKLLRDLTLRVRLTGSNVPAKPGVLELSLGPAGNAGSEPIGAVEPVIKAAAPLPEGSYKDKEVVVQLSAAQYLQAVKDRAAKDPKEAAEIAKAGIELPGAVQVAIRLQAKTGGIEVHHAELTATTTSATNQLRNGDFEVGDKNGYPQGWTPALKYRYFPPGHYYIFNTWHNSRFANRGSAAADSLLVYHGGHSLRMIVPPGDEMMVQSDPIVLKQTEPNLIEVSAMVKTDKLCMLQIDAYADDDAPSPSPLPRGGEGGVRGQGQRLDCFNFINKAPHSIGTDGWREIRQVFRPRTPIKSLRLALCARGVNGYTLDDTGQQPQNNVVGTIWWDDVRLSEPEGRSVIRNLGPAFLGRQTQVADLDLGERLLGENILRARVKNHGPDRTVHLEWKLSDPFGKEATYRSQPKQLKAGAPETLEVPYALHQPCPTAYTEYKGQLSLKDDKGHSLVSSELWLGTWTTPIDVELGAVYLRPEQKQFVRLNLGYSQATLANLKSVRLDLVRRGTGKVEKSWTVGATPAAILAQRKKIPADLRDDFANLLLTDLDVSFLPVQPFADPQRNWLIRAAAITAGEKELGHADSQPFCRQAHQPPQPPIQSVKIKGDLLYVNDQPWLPFGVCYGHNPVYAGPADPGPGKYRDLANIPAWSLYDRHSGELNSRKLFDFNTLRYVAGSITDAKTLEKRWGEDNLYCSTAFATPNPVFSLEEAFKQAGGKDKLDAYLAYSRKAPMVVSLTPGIEEAFGLFQGATPQQIQGMTQVVDYLRKGSGKPVMVSHGGYWNRFEFEKATYFDIFDPETEPFYPANLHTDLKPLIDGKDKVIWLRPQMYESVPYERWRFHVFVEMMRGARGWQVAHGMGDTSLMRGLHGEVEFFKPVLASKDPGPKVALEPWLEHWSRRHGGKTYLIAASTRGIALGKWTETDDAPPEGKRSRLTVGNDELRDESNAYAVGYTAESGPTSHGLQWLPDARAWPKGTKLVQWVKLDAKSPPGSFAILAKGDGRWTHAASWGKADLTPLRKDPNTAYWFLNVFYRHAKGFLGWGRDLLPKSLEYIPEKAVDQSPLPKAGDWVRLEIPLEKLGAADKLLDGVGFLHDSGKVRWGHTSLVAPDGTTKIVWGDDIALPPEQLTHVKVNVAGLKQGTKIRVLFEDRELTAQDGFFVDDFGGQDLYQRFGGGYGAGYGDAPVALHLYEMATP